MSRPKEWTEAQLAELDRDACKLIDEGIVKSHRAAVKWLSMNDERWRDYTFKTLERRIKEAPYKFLR